MRSRTVLTLGAVLATAVAAAPVLAQEYTEAWRLTGFAQPESASYDPGTGTLFISNISSPDFSPNGMGYIAQLSLDGEVIAERFVDGLNTPAGTFVSDGTLWVIAGGLAEIDIATGAIRNTFTSPDLAFPNDVFVAEDGRVFVTDTFGSAIFVLENGELTLWLRDPQLAGANGISVIGDTVYVARVGDVSGGFENMVPNGNIKTIDLATRAIGDFGSPDPIGGLDGIEPMDQGLMVTDHPGGRLLQVAPDGTVTELAMPGAGAADHESIPDEHLVIIPMLNTGEVIAYRTRM